jgi:hypothetical protein
MMDLPSLSEIEEHIVGYIKREGVVKLETLITFFRSFGVPDYGPVQTVLAGLVYRGRIDEMVYRPWPRYEARFIYFMGGTRMRPTSLTQEEMGERAKFRPHNFNQLSPQEQWGYDRALGILDWRGDLSES